MSFGNVAAVKIGTLIRSNSRARIQLRSLPPYAIRRFIDRPVALCCPPNRSLFFVGRAKVAWSRVLCFTDPLACQAAFPYSDVEVLPTTKDFRIEITQVAMSRLWLQRVHLSSPTVSTATSKPGRLSIGFVTESNLSPYHHCGIEVMPGDIIVNTLEAEYRRCDPDLDYGSVSIPTDELDTAVEA